MPAILVFGLGAHASKLALPPSEPALAHEGLGAIAFSIIAVLPAVGQIVTPALWGWLHTSHTRLAILLSSTGVLVGQALIMVGFLLRPCCHGVVARSVLALGIATFCVSRPGVVVGQASMLARAAPPQYLTCCFGAKVGVTSLIGVACNYAVPTVVQRHSGMLILQVALLVPAALGAVAGVRLSELHRGARLPPPQQQQQQQQQQQPPAAPPPSTTTERGSLRQALLAHDHLATAENGAATDAHRAATNGSAPRDGPAWAWASAGGNGSTKGAARAPPLARLLEAPALRAIVLLMLWRATAVGTLHAHRTLLVGTLFSYGLPSAEAGELVARNQLVALLALMVAAYLADWHRLRRVVVAANVGALAAACAVTAGLCLGESRAWEAGLFLLAVAGEVCPVLALAWFPRLASADLLPSVYGLGDWFDMIGEVVLLLLMGALREATGGFFATLVATDALLALGLLIALLLLRATRQPARSGPNLT